MPTARADLRALPLYEVPAEVQGEFCRVMDALPDRDWNKFASKVLEDITSVRLAEKKERRTDWVMSRWQNRNGSVGELLDLLHRLELLWPWDIINNWASTVPPRVESPLPLLSPGFTPHHRAPVSDQPTCSLSQSRMATLLPKPEPPELSSVIQYEQMLPQPLHESEAAASLGVMAWTYEEVYNGTSGFSASLKLGEGGFGEVFKATLRNTIFAVKKIKRDSSLDWNSLRDSFKAEVEQLSKFRHPNIVELLGYSVGEGTLCLIYNFMENRSLDDQLHSNGFGLSWCQRVSIVKGAASALQYLHCPPQGQPLVHGDVKSSNILLDHHLEAKLSDLGLARFSSSPSSHTGSHTRTIGKTKCVTETLAYLPEEYLRDYKMKTEVDVYGFGVVLLEIVTGRRALEKDKTTGKDIYLKLLVNDVENTEEHWRKQLDKRLISCEDSEPSGFMQVVSLAQSCLDKLKKRRPMKEVYKALDSIHNTSPSSLPSVLYSSSVPHPGPARSLDSCFSALSFKTSDPSKHAYSHKRSSLSPPQTLSSTVTPTPPRHSSPSSSLISSSFSGPCETDESRGFSQYNISPTKSGLDLVPQPSVPVEDQYNFPPYSEVMDSTENQAVALLECSPQARPLQSLSPVVSNSSKQQVFENRAVSQSPELLSSEDLYVVGSPGVSRLPEESDELEYLQSKTQ
ncbi:unnamed protein product [Knipowitschia caucasica]|uniref:Protein kinase domain-containing protein n=1 Tax=Knipowitschia caucasica TaxID=637954 RepID=A0AAV2LXQ0_KNICA